MEVTVADARPVAELDAELERALGRLDEFGFVQSQRLGVEGADVRHRRLAHADDADLLRFHQPHRAICLPGCFASAAAAIQPAEPPPTTTTVLIAPSPIDSPFAYKARPACAGLATPIPDGYQNTLTLVKNVRGWVNCDP